MRARARVHLPRGLSGEDPGLRASFFARDAKVVARALIGAYLAVRHADGDRIARIVETEAYRGPTDLACHARFGVTKRTKSLFAAPGHSYVFFIYGMHQCFNVTCLREGAGHAVLIRGVEPGLGMEGLRGDGPGRLTKSMGITRDHDGLDVTNEGEGRVRILPRVTGARGHRPKIIATPRIGVAYAGAIAEAPWRFLDSESASVSRPPASAIGLGLGKKTRLLIHAISAGPGWQNVHLQIRQRRRKHAELGTRGARGKAGRRPGRSRRRRALPCHAGRCRPRRGRRLAHPRRRGRGRTSRRIRRQ